MVYFSKTWSKLKALDLLQNKTLGIRFVNQLFFLTWLYHNLDSIARPAKVIIYSQSYNCIIFYEGIECIFMITVSRTYHFMISAYGHVWLGVYGSTWPVGFRKRLFGCLYVDLGQVPIMQNSSISLAPYKRDWNVSCSPGRHDVAWVLLMYVLSLNRVKCYNLARAI